MGKLRKCAACSARLSGCVLPQLPGGVLPRPGVECRTLEGPRNRTEQRNQKKGTQSSNLKRLRRLKNPREPPRPGWSGCAACCTMYCTVPSSLSGRIDGVRTATVIRLMPLLSKGGGHRAGGCLERARARADGPEHFPDCLELLCFPGKALEQQANHGGLGCSQRGRASQGKASPVARGSEARPSLGMTGRRGPDGASRGLVGATFFRRCGVAVPMRSPPRPAGTN